MGLIGTGQESRPVSDEELVREWDGNIEDESVIVQAVGSGWVVTHHKQHSVIGVLVEKEVFLDANAMLKWLLKRLSGENKEKG